MTLSCGVNDKYGVSLDEFKAMLPKIVERAEAAHVKVMILTATGGGEKYSECLRSGGREKMRFGRPPDSLPESGRRQPVGSVGQRLGASERPWIPGDGQERFRAFGLDEAQMAKAEKRCWTNRIPLSIRPSSRSAFHFGR